MSETLDAVVPQVMAGQRLDQVLAALFPQHSRSRLQQWLRAGQVCVVSDLAPPTWRPKDKVAGGERISIDTQLDARVAHDAPEALPLDIVFEDDAIIVIDKPAGLVVHPAAGHWAGTLLNALLHHSPQVADLPRAGIVHRLDKDTSGLLVVARTAAAHTSLVEQLQARVMGREYDAVVAGVMTGGGQVAAPLGRHALDRKRRAVTPAGKPALSHYRVIRRFRAHSHISVTLETGRTHQIRVHMAHIRYPVVGDPLYGGRPRLPPRCHPLLSSALTHFKRQALHAAKLAFTHPVSGAVLNFQAPMPADMTHLLNALAEDADAMAERGDH